MASKKSTKVEVVDSAKSAEVVKTASTLDAVAIVKKVGELGLQVQAKLDEVKRETLNSLNEFNTLREAIEYSKKELAELHAIEATSTSLKELEEQFAITVRDHNASVTAMVDTAAKTAAAIKQERAREEEEYAYNLKIKRRNEAQEHAEKMAAANAAHLAKVATAEEAITKRYATLAALEAEYTAAVDAAKAFPAKLEAAEKAARAQGINIAASEAKTAANIAQLTFDKDIALLRNQCETLELQNKRLEQQVREFSMKLESAEKRVENMAVGALNSASGRAALEALQQNNATKPAKP